MKKYESYKDSGVDWIGEIPKSWSSSRLKFISSIEKGRIPSVTFQDQEKDMVPYLSMDYLRGNTESPEYVKTNDPKLIPVDLNDLLVLWDGSKAGEIVKAKSGALSSTMGKIHISDTNFDISFLSYFLKSAERYLQDNTVGMGIPHVNGTILRSLFIAKPSKTEQIQIARYLDHQTKIIDELIQRKERLVLALEAKRKSVINEAVTEGLNPIVKMKDSGIDWIGEIPEHWQIKRLRYLGKCQNGVSAGSDYFGEGDPFLSYSDVYKNEALPDQIFGLARSSNSDKANYSVLEGDIFFTRTSETVDEIGLSSVCINTVPNAVFAGFLIRFRPNDSDRELHKGFSKFYFRSYFTRHHLIKEMNLVTRASLSQELLKSVPVLLPPFEEQEKIGDHLELLTNTIVITIQKINSAIEKLKEYRQSLISEVVTGKIDVQQWEPLN